MDCKLINKELEEKGYCIVPDILSDQMKLNMLKANLKNGKQLYQIMIECIIK